MFWHYSLCFPCRSSLPITKQANKNLILKATAEAEKSVSSAMDSVLKEEKLYSAKGKSSYFRYQRIALLDNTLCMKDLIYTANLNLLQKHG